MNSKVIVTMAVAFLSESCTSSYPVAEAREGGVVVTARVFGGALSKSRMDFIVQSEPGGVVRVALSDMPGYENETFDIHACSVEIEIARNIPVFGATIVRCDHKVIQFAFDWRSRRPVDFEIVRTNSHKRQ